MSAIIRRLSFLVLILILDVSGQPLIAQNQINPILLNDHWKASWITHPTASTLDYGVFHFRKIFSLSEKPETFLIHVSADNRYRLFVNGQPIGMGPSRGDLAHWFYESYDLAPYLKQGENVLAATVWNFGLQKPWGQFSIQTAFIVQGDTPRSEAVNTNTSWLVFKNEAYQQASAGSDKTAGQFVVVGPCDRVDGSKYPWGWEMLNYKTDNWIKAKRIDVGHPRGVGTGINWVLTPRRIPMMEHYPQRFSAIRNGSGPTPPEGWITNSQKWIIPANSQATVLLDQGVLTTGYPELTTCSGNGSTIKLTYAESLFDQKRQKGDRSEIKDKIIIGYSDWFLPDGGENRVFRPLWFRTWRYLQLEIITKDQPLEIAPITSEFSAYPLKEIASFDANRSDLAKIWEIGWRTARLCANETYFDCPYYEQLQYVGDTRIQALISLYVSGDDRLVRAALLSYGESIFHEGLTQSRYPCSNPQVIPPFSLYWIDMVHDYWTLRNDQKFVKSFMTGIDQVINWFDERVDPQKKMLGKVEYWNFVDWAKEWPWADNIGGVPSGGGRDGYSSILTLQYAYALDRAAELATAFGDSYHANLYKSKSAVLKKGTMALCWDPGKGYLADTPDRKAFSLHAQIFAILTDAIPLNQQKELCQRMLNDKNLIQPTMYFRFYLTQALKKCGLADQYLNTLTLWHEMVAKNLTTFAENPDPTRSDCHAWSASPNYDFLATVVGIRPASPGFKTVRIEPAFGDLTSLKGQMPHPEGLIKFDLQKEPGEHLKGMIELPGTLKGELIWKGEKLLLQGKKSFTMK